MYKIEKLMIDLESTIEKLDLLELNTENQVLIRQVNSKGMIEYNDVEGFLGNMWKVIKSFFKKIWEFIFGKKKTISSSLSEITINGKKLSEIFKDKIKINMTTQDLLCLFEHYNLSHYFIYYMEDLSVPYLYGLKKDSFDLYLDQNKVTGRFEEMNKKFQVMHSNVKKDVTSRAKNKEEYEKLLKVEMKKYQDSIRQLFFSTITLTIREINLDTIKRFDNFIEDIENHKKIYENLDNSLKLLKDVVAVIKENINKSHRNDKEHFIYFPNIVVTDKGFSIKIITKDPGVYKNIDFTLKPPKEISGEFKKIDRVAVDDLTKSFKDVKAESEKIEKNTKEFEELLSEGLKSELINTDSSNKVFISVMTKFISTVVQIMVSEYNNISLYTNKFEQSLSKMLDNLRKDFMEKTLEEQKEKLEKIKESCK